MQPITQPITSVATKRTNEVIISHEALLRWSLVVVFLWFGGMKFTGYEAQGIAPFIENSPFMAWLIDAFGVRGASAVIGVMELSTAVTLTVGAFHHRV
ncbi:DUF417 family protein, partial [Cupriavidus oxalaticus]|uniref:DUF417 family protein n=1 Tax=Cupriavidus oxalaticus TaxID=96344 RepID=UPI003177BB72